MKIRTVLLLLLLILAVWMPAQAADAPTTGNRFLTICLGDGFHVNRDVVAKIAALRPSKGNREVRLGMSAIFSYFNMPRETLAKSLADFLRLAEEFDLPVVVQFDGEHWRKTRPDLWNWGDPSLPGFDPEHRQDVEWDGWGPEHAIRISWINWGRQVRIRPAQNLMSPRYRKAVHEELWTWIPQVRDWWRQLPAEKKDLFVGIKLGHESSIGVNGFYYPNGNDYLSRPEKDDPHKDLATDRIPDRGMATIGYAAVSTLGLAKSGELREEHLAEVIRVHLRDMCEVAHGLGVPRERLFTHCGGWKPGERLYASAVNEFSCPGWSFYSHGMDPRRDTTAMAAIKTSDAPYWGAVEWLPLGAKSQRDWEKAFRNTLFAERCRYLCIFNWKIIEGSHDATRAITAVLERSDGRR